MNVIDLYILAVKYEPSWRLFTPFIALNRKTALNNIKYTCPEFSGYVNSFLSWRR